MKIYCKYNLFWIKGAKAEVLKLILSLVIAFKKKQLVLTFLWDPMMDFHGIKCKLFLIYVVMGLRVAILRFLCKSNFFMLKALKIKKYKKLLQKNQFLPWIKFAILSPITTWIRDNLHFVPWKSIMRSKRKVTTSCFS